MWGDRYVLGFAPALRFLPSEILRRLYENPSGETINRGLPCGYTDTHKYNIHTLKIPQSMSGRPRWISEILETTHNDLNVSVLKLLKHYRKRNSISFFVFCFFVLFLDTQQNASISRPVEKGTRQKPCNSCPVAKS